MVGSNDPEQRGKTVGKWLELTAENYISPETVTDTRQSIIEDNQRKFLSATRACVNCAFSRANGVKIQKELMHLPIDEYAASLT